MVRDHVYVGTIAVTPEKKRRVLHHGGVLKPRKDWTRTALGGCCTFSASTFLTVLTVVAGAVLRPRMLDTIYRDR